MVAYRNGLRCGWSELGNVRRQRRGRQDRVLVLHPSDEQRAIILGAPAAAGHQHHRGHRRIKKLLPAFQAELPPSVHMDIRYDRSKTIRESYRRHPVHHAADAGAGDRRDLPVPAQFLGHHHPSLALPFSIVGTFAVMYLLDYSLDNLSMMALILSVGFVVDDAIVMLENIVRHMEMGREAAEAALIGSQRDRLHHRLDDMSLAAVFIPILFMGGILGRLFREFAVTICVAILISGFVSVTLTPMLCSRFLRVKHTARHGFFADCTERGVRRDAATSTTGPSAWSCAIAP